MSEAGTPVYYSASLFHWALPPNLTTIVPPPNPCSKHSCRLLCHDLLLASKHISSRCDVSCLDFLLCEGVLGITHVMEVGAVRIIAADVFDESRAVFGCAVGGTDVAAIMIETIEGKDTGKGVLLFE